MSAPEPVAAVERIAAAFVAALRRVGIVAPVGSALNFYEALGQVGVADRSAVYWSGRATLIHRPDDVELYDRVFGAFWEGDAVLLEQLGADEEESVSLAVDSDDEGGEGEDSDLPVITLRYSAHEVLGDKDFSDYDDDELAEAQRLMQRMAVVGGRRASRRRVPTRRTRGRPDLRRTVRQALRSAGEPIDRRYTTSGDRLRRVVFLLDVSGSMETYARALVRFAQAAVAGRRRVEVFTLGTRLTRVTR